MIPLLFAQNRAQRLVSTETQTLNSFKIFTLNYNSNKNTFKTIKITDVFIIVDIVTSMFCFVFLFVLAGSFPSVFFSNFCIRRIMFTSCTRRVFFGTRGVFNIHTGRDDKESR